MNELARAEASEPEIWRPSAALNPQRLDYLFGLAERMAFMAAVPETLRGERSNGTFTPFDDRTIVANVFAVVEQADRWNVSPFALLASAAIVRGKLAFEGKAIAGVLENQFGIKLHAYYRGEPGTDSYHIYLCDQELPDEVLAELQPRYRHDRYKIMDGSVAGWKTTDRGSPWRPDTFADMLVYRGTRQWVRVYKSALLLGVLADDEVQNFEALEAAAQRAVPIGERFAAPPKQGFNADNVAAALEHKPAPAMEIIDKDTGEVIPATTSGAQPGGNALKTTAEPKADKAPASATPAEESAGNTRDGQTDSGGRPDETPSSAAIHTPTDDGTGGDAASPARVSATIFHGYYSALARMTSAESVNKAHEAFWKGEGKGSKPTHPDDLQLARDIRDNNLLRVEGKITADNLKKEVDAWIASVCGGGL